MKKNIDYGQSIYFALPLEKYDKSMRKINSEVIICRINLIFYKHSNKVKKIFSHFENADILQELYCRVVAKIHLFNNSKSVFTTYIYNVTRWSSLALIKEEIFKNRAEMSFSELLPDKFEMAEFQMWEQQRRAEIVLDGFDEIVPILICENKLNGKIFEEYLRNKTQKEIAEILKISEITVKNRMRRIKQFVKKFLKEREENS